MYLLNWNIKNFFINNIYLRKKKGKNEKN
jgi:hypothetical protein